MYTAKDEPLARAMSLMGRVGAERIYRDRLRPQLSTRRQSLQEFRVSSTAATTRPAPEDALPGMEVLRGVYSLAQVNTHYLFIYFFVTIFNPSCFSIN